MTPGVVQRAFERLEWPAAELFVEPDRGWTLVQLETNFYTTNTEPSRQVVVLFGVEVEVEASPVSWTWRFTEGKSVWEERHRVVTTSSPGAPLPVGSVSHVYRWAGQVFRPRVDTTYVGRFRVDGGGWQEIPESLTVPGVPIELATREAAAVLVDPHG